MKKIAIITGASSGLGKEFARILNSKSNIDEIWAIARNLDNLKKLQNEFGKKIKIYSMDISDISNIKNFKNTLLNSDIEILYLINNAGFAKFCSYNDISIDDAVNMINLNISGVVAMVMLCVPFMKKGSHIVNIASQAAFQPLPYQNIYSSTKVFVRNYSRALNVELKENKISVTAVCPGWIKTNLFQRANIGVNKATNKFVGIVEPKNVAEKAISDADKEKDMSVYSIYVKLCHLAAKILPQKVIMKIWLKQQGM